MSATPIPATHPAMNTIIRIERQMELKLDLIRLKLAKKAAYCARNGIK